MREAKSSRLPVGLGLAAILLLAIALRLIGIGDAFELGNIRDRSLWLDEVYTLALTAGRDLDAGLPAGTLIDPPPPRLTGTAHANPIWRVAVGSREITHPPVYFVLLRLWRQALGDGDVVARLFSVFWSVLAVGLIYDVGRLLSGRATGLWAAAVLAAAVPQVTYAQEVRNYSIQLPFALAAAGALLRIERGGPTWPRLVGLSASLLLLVLSHYFAVGVAATMGVYALVQLRGRSRRMALAAMAAAGLVFLLAWAPVMWQQRHVMAVGAGENPWFYDAAPGRAWRALRDAALVPARLLHHPTDEEVGPLGWAGAAFYILPLALWRRRPDLRLPLLWLVGAVAVVLALDVTRSSIHLSYIRYTLLAGPGLYLIAAALLAPYGRWRHVLPALAVVAGLIALPDELASATVDWRRPAAFVRAHARPGDVILSSSEGGWGYEAHSQLLFLSHYLGELPGPVVVVPRRPGAPLLDALRGRRVWVVIPHGRADASAVLPGTKFSIGTSERDAVEIWLAEWPEPAPGRAP